MKKWYLFTLPVACLLVGCFGVVQDDNSLSLTWTTGLVWTQTGPAEKESVSKLGIDFPPWMQKPVIDWIYEHQMSPNNEVVVDLSE